MFLIFSLRRPNILPYTDLGVQKGLLRFALTAHGAFPEAKGKFQLGKKRKDQEAKEKAAMDKAANAGQIQLKASADATRATTPPPHPQNGLPPTPYTPSNETQVIQKQTVLHTPNAPRPMVLPPTPLSPGPSQVTQTRENELNPAASPDDLLEPVLDGKWDAHRIAPLDAGLTIEIMKSRWSGKKAK